MKSICESIFVLLILSFSSCDQIAPRSVQPLPKSHNTSKFTWHDNSIGNWVSYQLACNADGLVVGRIHESVNDWEASADTSDNAKPYSSHVFLDNYYTSEDQAQAAVEIFVTNWNMCK